MLLKVENMSCVHCKNKIEKTLKEMGIKKIKINLESKLVTITSKKHTIEEVIQAIKAIGYDCLEV